MTIEFIFNMFILEHIKRFSVAKN